MIKTIDITTNKRNEMIDITDEVIGFAKDINEGIITLFVPHTTAALTINENADPDVKKDMLRKLSELVPMEDNYDHTEGNSDAHIKASLFGNSLQVIVKDGKLVLGTWQGIYFCEFDGPRKRKLIVKY